jgi:DnaJ-domain-containing protein 1
MTDNFAVLSQPRRPWLDLESLKQKFLQLSAEVHPDRAHDAAAEQKREFQIRYTELNTAYQCLREPKERVRHLIELERGTRPEQVQRIPPELMDLSLEVGQACRAADALLGEKSKTTSPLLQVDLFTRAQQKIEELMAFQRQLEAKRESLLVRLKELDEEWATFGKSNSNKRSATLDWLEELRSLLSYYERWVGQVRERIVQLSF